MLRVDLSPPYLQTLNMRNGTSTGIFKHVIFPPVNVFGSKRPMQSNSKWCGIYTHNQPAPPPRSKHGRTDGSQSDMTVSLRAPTMTVKNYSYILPNYLVFVLFCVKHCYRLDPTGFLFFQKVCVLPVIQWQVC